MSSHQEAELTAVTGNKSPSQPHTSKPKEKLMEPTKPWGVFQTSIPVDSPSCA